MPVQRSSQQQHESLEEFYTRDGVGIDFQHVGQQMLLFIRLINELFPDTQLYGLTSHYHLQLQNEDVAAADTLVDVVGVAGDFYFEYLVPRGKAPWYPAYLKGTAHSLEEARKFLLLAMRESEGWNDSQELKQHLLELGI